MDHKFPKDVGFPCYKIWVAAVVVRDAIQATSSVTATQIRGFLFCIYSYNPSVHTEIQPNTCSREVTLKTSEYRRE